MRARWMVVIGAGLLAVALVSPGSAQAQGPIKIGLVQGISGPFEVYAKQIVTGFKLGLEYATGGKLEVLGRKIEVLVEDDQLKPDVAKRLVTKLYADDKVDLVVATTSSAAALAVLPVAAEFKKVLIVEPAVADSITGEHWNRYIFRTGRNSGQDAIANALAVAKPGVSIATIAQDYAFGKDGVAAYKAAVEKLGGKVVHEEYAPIQATDFTAPIQKIIGALKDKQGPKYVFVIWAGKGGPYPQLVANRLDKYGITLSASGNLLDVMKGMKAMNLDGSVGGTYYYYELPKNAVNDWLVKEHQARFKEPPDFFTSGGFAAAMAAVTAIQKAGGTDAEKLIAAMEGMEFTTPKGKMIFRKDDHQALQTMYSIKLLAKPDVAWLVPTLLKELSPQETAPPILNKR
ncbi:MAG: ABC transporter permease [Candidatus Rokubacteria bacterium GWC2_70_24]|nr:MAG: ABC transporter permease [Candidatus Rokubacteria bacterium GWA2_70_23]OGK93163.1 MAG: ABC transporter permease [Candidatus Rokubacteria bacterium GWC2_70_24]